MARLTALWALSEAGLGGIMHFFRTPFTGLVVGGVAVILILLIGHLAEQKTASILRALFIVLLIKGLVSPHSPPTAYLAVSFQGLCAVGLFAVFRSPTVVGLLLGGLALLESAVQKILMLTLFFGNSLWEAIDAFSLQLFEQFGWVGLSNTSLWLIAAYTGGYLIAGLAIGWWGGRFARRLPSLMDQFTPPVVTEPGQAPDYPETSAWRRFWRRTNGHFILLALLLVASFWLDDVLNYDPIILLLRTLCAIVLWYGIVTPLFLDLLSRLFRKSRMKRGQELDLVIQSFPQLRALAMHAWKDSESLRGTRRLTGFFTRLVVYSLHTELPASAPVSAVHAGKQS